MIATTGPASFCVLDVETALSENAVALASAGERPGIARAALHELVGGSALFAERDAAGHFGWFRHVSVGDSGEGEPAMLRALDDALRPAHDGGAWLATFNGAHDLSALRRRACRHWLFDALCLPDWRDPAGGRHLDLMRLDPAGEAGRWPSLIDAAAGYGINAVCPRARAASSTVCAAVRKAEVDTCATMLLLFHHLAAEERSIEPLVQGWAALSTWLIATRGREDHLRQFARHPFATVARDLARPGKRVSSRGVGLPVAP